ncbi:MAG: tyrosine-type recombinase/integrase [Lachnospiraceae bacterium]|nr:tyrosine-type recombinase/integrase [Lachnospiraceae bacterium]
MSTTQPIRDKKQLRDFKDYYKNSTPDLRNYTLIIVGLNTALRINDILHLTYDAVYTGKKVRSYLVVKERKTGKENRIFLNHEITLVLAAYRKILVKTQMHRNGNPYLFPSPVKKDVPLSRYQAYRIIAKAAADTGLEDHISCHSLRKTFGYHAWRQGTDPMLIMTVLNHSSIKITMRYLCIEQEDKDKVFRNLRI